MYPRALGLVWANFGGVVCGVIAPTLSCFWVFGLEDVILRLMAGEVVMDAEEGDFALPGVVVVALRRGGVIEEIREVVLALVLGFAMTGDV
jgi:hypothetical protein